MRAWTTSSDDVSRPGASRAATAFPAGFFPRYPSTIKRCTRFYAKCVELGLPIFCCAGVPGPRVPFAPRKVELIDEVLLRLSRLGLRDPPRLRAVGSAGSRADAEVAATCAARLRRSRRALPAGHHRLRQHRGADKIIYAGYFPWVLHIDRIMTGVPQVGFQDEVPPKFLPGQRQACAEALSERRRGTTENRIVTGASRGIGLATAIALASGAMTSPSPLARCTRVMSPTDRGRRAPSSSR